MRASHFRAENRDERRFCSECGAHLTATCSSCGFDNEVAQRFCGGCGTVLPSGPRLPDSRFQAPVASTPRHLADRIPTSRAAIEGERKQVSARFTDTKRPMELLVDRDPEEEQKVLDLSSSS